MFERAEKRGERREEEKGEERKNFKKQEGAGSVKRGGRTGKGCGWRRA